jgi:hypothetical protein
MKIRRNRETDEVIRRALQLGFVRLRTHAIERGGIIGLEKQEYDELIQKGELTGDIFKKERYNDEPLIDGIHFTCWDEAQEDEDLIDWEPPSTILPFLKHAHLCYYRESQTPVLKLIFKESIFDILSEIAEDIDRQGLPLLSDIDARKSPLHLSRSGKERLMGVNSVCGRIATCDWPECGDPFCSSELAWVENGICFVYMDASAAGVGSVFLFPFRTS